MKESTRQAAAAAATGDGSRGPSVPWVLASLSLCMLLPSLGISIANVALPTLAEAFDASFQDVQWVVLAYLLANTTLVVSIGRLGDLVGRKRLLLAGLGLFTLASAVCGVAPALWLLWAARAAQGVGAAAMMVLTITWVGETVPKARAGSAMGMLGTMSAVGTALGPTLGGGLIGTLGWPAIFWLNVPLGLLALWLAHRHLPADRRIATAARPRLDVAGTLLLALSLAAYALSMTVGRGGFGVLNATLLAASAFGAGLFVRVQARTAAPLVRLERFRDPLLSAGLAASTIVAAVLMSTLVVGPFYLARALGLDAAGVGLVMSVGPLVAACAGVPAGRAVDRIGTRRTGVLGLAGIAGGCLALSLLPVSSGIAGYVLPLALLTGAYALFQAANNTAVMHDVPEAQRGATSGLLNLSRHLGLVTGASAMGGVFALATATRDVHAASPHAVAAGLHITFAVAFVLVLLALAITLAGRQALARRLAHGAG